MVCKRFFALQHRFLQRGGIGEVGPRANSLLTLGLYDAGHAVPLAPRGSSVGPSQPWSGRPGPFAGSVRKDSYAARQSLPRSGTTEFRRICWRRSARVESGRRDPVTGDWHPWPWTLDVEGEGAFYETKAQAVAAVQAAQARGVRSIDVGCAQINLLHHPNAFASLDIALDPQANANYAAQFLKELYGQSGDWNKAAAAYHSATPEIGAEYQRKVLAVWPEETRLAGTFSPSASPLSRSWGATLTGASSGIAPVLHAQPSGMGVASENDHATGRHLAEPRPRGEAWPPIGRRRSRSRSNRRCGEPGCNQ